MRSSLKSAVTSLTKLVCDGCTTLVKMKRINCLAKNKPRHPFDSLPHALLFMSCQELLSQTKTFLFKRHLSYERAQNTRVVCMSCWTCVLAVLFQFVIKCVNHLVSKHVFILRDDECFYMFYDGNSTFRIFGCKTEIIHLHVDFVPNKSPVQPLSVRFIQRKSIVSYFIIFHKILCNKQLIGVFFLLL